MKNDNSTEIISNLIAVACFCAIGAVGFYAGHVAGKQAVQREAVQQKQAHYAVDDEGKTTFVWGAKK